MKKIMLLLLIILAAACSKKLNAIEQDYYIIIHEIVPLQNEFAKKSSEPLYRIKEAIENGKEYDIDKAISDIENTAEETREAMRKKAEKLQSGVSSAYIDLKTEYVAMVSFYSIEMLKAFKNSEDKTLNTFKKILADNVEKSSNQMKNLLEIDAEHLEKIKKMVDK